MAWISQHINSKNREIRSYGQMRKFILSLVSKIYYKKDNFYPKLTHLHNSLLMSIVETTKKDLSHSEGKSFTSKFHTYLVSRPFYNISY